MNKLLPTDKSVSWYLSEMKEHVIEIRELLDRGETKYRGDITCAQHAKTEAYDLIVLTAELFNMDEVIEAVPDKIIERFNKKRR
ncbi:MAG: hypothetical protein B6U97_03140 [Candidatus Altiarchaeales archaeon ex4484_96]|nr:MAG: hypothetical protein B6U97_03140 [Candidatus Altiarchaeales archaeon ex4484_96]